VKWNSKAHFFGQFKVLATRCDNFWLTKKIKPGDSRPKVQLAMSGATGRSLKPAVCFSGVSSLYFLVFLVDHWMSDLLGAPSYIVYICTYLPPEVTKTSLPRRLWLSLIKVLLKIRRSYYMALFAGLSAGWLPVSWNGELSNLFLPRQLQQIVHTWRMRVVRL